MNGNRVVSYSFFRHSVSPYESERAGDSRGKFFVNYLRGIVRAHQCIWSGWRLRFYHDDRVTEFPYWKVMEKLHEAGLVELFYAGPADEYCKAMIWRMRPIWDGNIEYVVCRDVDSIPVPRCRRAVEEFIQSGAAIHVIHDASAHSGIMGGTSAFHSEAFKALTRWGSWTEMVNSKRGHDWNHHGADQEFLNQSLWIKVADRKYMPRERPVLLMHELHHETDMAHHVPFRRTIDISHPPGTHPAVIDQADVFARVIGGCTDVEKPVAFYNSLAKDVGNIQRIIDIEKEVLK